MTSPAIPAAVSPPALPVNKAAQAANSIIKGIESAAQPLIEAAIIAAVPDLGLPVVKQITVEIEKILEDEIAKYLETGADFLIYDIQTTTEDANISSAQQGLNQAILSGDPASIAAAKKVLTDAEDALTIDDGSAQPQ